MNTSKTVKLNSEDDGDKSGQIYLQGSYYFEQLHNHYPVTNRSQSFQARIVIKSDKAVGPINWIALDFINLTPRPSDTYISTLPPKVIDVQDLEQINHKALSIPVPISFMSAWLHLLTKAPKDAYYIDYVLSEIHNYALLGVSPAASQTIGL